MSDSINGVQGHSVKELFSAFGEYVGLEGGQQLISIDCTKQDLLGSYVGEYSGFPFALFLPQKGYHLSSKHNLACSLCTLTKIYRQMFSSK